MMIVTQGYGTEGAPVDPRPPAWSGDDANLVAAAVTGFPTKVNLTWDVAVHPGGFPVEYLVERSDDGGGIWNELGHTDGLIWQNHTLSPSTTYDYRVRARSPILTAVWTEAGSGSTVEYVNGAVPNLAVGVMGHG